MDEDIVFRSYFERWKSGESGKLDWDLIDVPGDDFLRPYSSLDLCLDRVGRDVLSRLAVVKLNGGLGTTMGCEGPKSLLEIQDDQTFLGVILDQMVGLRKSCGVDVPLVLMNSFNTDETTREFLGDNDSVRCFLQGRFPRILAGTGELHDSFNPPGHGDLYRSILDSGVLDDLISEGTQYLFVSNSDNLGAAVDFRLLGLMERDGLDFLMETTEKTESDVKGGTLVLRDGRLRLLEIAQVPEAHVQDFQDLSTFKVFNTNNIWIRVSALKSKLESGKLDLDLIVNPKTVGGVDVIQLETAMGSAIGVFENSVSVVVPRSRFLPVKSVADLDLLRGQFGKTVYIFANGPGEISNWVLPVCHAISRFRPDTRVVVLLLKCRFATGNEYEIVKGFPNVESVYHPHETMRILFQPGYGPEIRKHAVVLYLGGDPFYTLWFSKRHGLEAVAFSERPLSKRFKRVFLRQDDGDLMYDSSLLSMRPRNAILKDYGLEDREYCCFLPGSRVHHFEYLVIFYRDAVRYIQARHPEFRAILVVSPFISDDVLKKAAEEVDLSMFQVIRGNSRELISISKLMVTMPGTNTAESMYMGTPAMMFAPLNWPKRLIYEGIAGLLSKMPLLGIYFAKLAIWAWLRRQSLFSIPNILAGREIIPEFVREMGEHEMGGLVEDKFYDEAWLAKTRVSLEDVRPKREVAPLIVDALFS